MHRLAVAAVEPGDLRPHILDPDRQQEALRGEGPPAVERRDEAILLFLSNRAHATIDQLRSVAGSLGAAALTQLGWGDAVQSQIAVDPARLPVARVAGIDDDHGVQIAREKERAGEPSRPPADDGDVV